jgi:tetratricopeptide (TPR) repeat protein
VKGVFPDILFISDQLKLKTRHCEQNLTLISTVLAPSALDLNDLDQSFMYSQLLTEILLEMQYDKKAKQLFANLLRIYDVNNNERLRMINEFEQDYALHSPIWWYTKEPFIYSTLNTALRTQDIEMIITMGFFVQDLHRQIEQLHADTHRLTKLVLYRGQGMLTADFKKIKKRKGGLLSFNNFLSTSTDRQLSFTFADSSRDNPDLTGILFRLEIDPSISSTPFATLDNVSYFSDLEKEILFSMYAVFRIIELNEIEERLWQVSLTLTSDNDEQLKYLTVQMREEIGEGTGWHRLAHLMIKMGEFDNAQEVYKTLIEVTSDDSFEYFAYLHHQLGYINNEKGDLATALFYYKRCLDIYLTHLPSDNPTLSPTYANIGLILKKKGDLDGALKHYQHSLNTDLRDPQIDQLSIAVRYNNIGTVLDEQGKYDEALENFQKALKIKLDHLSPGHPSVANTYINIGKTQSSMKNYSSALSYYEKALKIQEKTLPLNHPSLAVTCHNMGRTLEGLYRYKEAVKHAERAVDIAHHTFDLNHPQIQLFQEYLDKLVEKL